jgi:hypothetical protein
MILLPLEGGGIKGGGFDPSSVRLHSGFGEIRPFACTQASATLIRPSDTFSQGEKGNAPPLLSKGRIEVGSPFIRLR